MASAGDSWIGKSVPRVEDPQLIQGQGLYVSDIHFDGQWSMALVRSTHAHARITAIHTDAAKQLAGVHAVVTAFDYEELQRPLAGIERISPPVLAFDRVFYVGQPIVAILADNRYIAEDAVDLVTIDYDPLPALINAEEAAKDEIVLHASLGTNIFEKNRLVSGSGQEAMKDADYVVAGTFRMGRVTAQPMEPRAIAAQYDRDQDTLLVYHASQSIHRPQERIAEFLGMQPHQVRVIVPEVGGGFGVKNGSYSEETLVTFFARQLQHPVKWVGDRFEEFLSTYQEREQTHHVELGLKKDGTIVALTDTFYHDNGAYGGGGIMVAQNTTRNIPGPYRVPNFAITECAVLTNKVPQTPYRGAGRPQGHYVIERILDRACDELGFDRAEIRMKNLVRPEDFPFKTGVPGVILDSGDYPAIFAEILEMIDLPALRRRQNDERKHGIRIGLGLSNCVEISAGFGFEGVRLTLQPDGKILLTTGATNQGQGHRTALAQIAADALQVPLHQVTVIEGDTQYIQRSIGTFGSRTIIMAGNAVRMAGIGFIDQAREAAANILEAHVEDVQFDDGRFFVKGVPSVALEWTDLARAVEERASLAMPQYEDYFNSGQSTYGFGSHAAIVRVDEKTHNVKIERYIILHDSGKVVNPLLANGQVIGGAVQGLGTALYEEMLFSDDGQPLTTSFLDYRIPGAAEMPDFEVHHRDFPAPTNPDGYKGVGEAGIIPSQAIMLSAVEDAYSDIGLRLDYSPITPGRLFRELAKSEVPS